MPDYMPEAVRATKTTRDILKLQCLKKVNPHKALGALWGFLRFFLAEGEGFEPPEVLPSMVFKTTAIGRSAIPPQECRETILPNSQICQL